MAKRIARNNELAEDALQISWLKIILATNVAIGGQKACPWVSKIVVNTVRDLQREDRHRNEVPVDNVENFELEYDLEMAIQEQQMLELLREVVKTIPSIYRRVYELRIQEELTINETAEKLDITRSNVTTRLNRAVKMIESRLKKRINSFAKQDA